MSKARRFPFTVVWVMLLSVTAARGSLWRDPDWETMLADSDLIGLAEVVEGGAFHAKMRITKVLKGERPKGPHVYVYGFNNPDWPPRGVKAESFKDGETYYLFLQKRKPYESELGGIGKDPPPAFNALVAAYEAGNAYSVWTPTAGDVPVAEGKVRYSLLKTGYSQYAPSRPQERFERILRAALAWQATGKADEPFLDGVVQGLRFPPADETGGAALAQELMCLYL